MRRCWTPAHALLALVIAVLGVVGPFIWASTADSWGEGIHDAESDNVLQAVVSVEGIVDHFPAQPIGHAVVTALVQSADDSAPAPSGVLPLLPRAPPLP